MTMAIRKSALSFVQILAIVYAWGFGLFASWRLDRFEKGLMFPPVAWFDSVYFWFAPSDYEKHWDANVEQLGYLIIRLDDDNTTMGKYGVELSEMLHQWINDIPSAKRTALATDFSVLKDALVDSMVDYMLETVSNQGKVIFPAIPVALAKQPAMVRIWKRVAAIMAAEVNNLILSIDKSEHRSKEAQDRVSLWAGNAKRRMAANIDYWLQ